MKKKEGKKRKNKEKIHFIYLILKSGKKTVSRKVIDAGQFSFFCVLHVKLGFRESIVFVVLNKF